MAISLPFDPEEELDPTAFVNECETWQELAGEMSAEIIDLPGTVAKPVLMAPETIQLFNSSYDEIEENLPGTLIHHIIVRDAILAVEEDSGKGKRLTTTVMMRLLHDIAVPNHGKMYSCADRAIALLSTELRLFPPDSAFARAKWLHVLAGRVSKGKKGRYLARVAERWRLFFFSLISDEEVEECVLEWILFILQTDLLLLQKKKDNSSQESSLFHEPIFSDEDEEDVQKESAAVAPLKSFPLALLLLYDPGEKRKRGLDQPAIESLLKLSKAAKRARKKASMHSSCLSRVVCVVLESHRWYLSSVLGLFRDSPARRHLGIELGQSVARLVSEMHSLSLAPLEMSDLFPVQWMREIVQEEEEKSNSIQF